MDWIGGKSGEKEGGEQKLGIPDRNTRGARNVIPDHLVCVSSDRLKERALGQGSAIARFCAVGGPHKGEQENRVLPVKNRTRSVRMREFL